MVGVEILQLSDSFVCIYDNIWTVLLEDVQDDDGGENVNVVQDVDGCENVNV